MPAPDPAQRRAIEDLLLELIEGQERRLRTLGIRIVPEITWDDLLSPDDVPRLRNDPEFMYEQGVLTGYLSAHTAFRAWCARQEEPGA